MMTHSAPDDSEDGSIRAIGMEDINTRECFELLESAQVGRLGVVVEGKPEIFPVNYVLDVTGAVVLQTAPGMKLAAALNHSVVFEVDDSSTRGTAWSVVVHGVAHHTALRSVKFASGVPESWSHGRTDTLRVHPTSVTGRRFVGTKHPS
jgi:uncharacterized protein